MSDILKSLRDTSDWGDLCDNCEGCRVLRREAATEIERLRLLIRCETIQPPSDVTDDCTTELAVELAQAKAESERLRSALDAISELVLQLPSGIEYDPDPDNPSPNDTFAFLGGLIMKEINLATNS